MHIFDISSSWTGFSLFSSAKFHPRHDTRASNGCGLLNVVCDMNVTENKMTLRLLELEGQIATVTLIEEIKVLVFKEAYQVK